MRRTQPRTSSFSRMIRKWGYNGRNVGAGGWNFICRSRWHWPFQTTSQEKLGSVDIADIFRQHQRHIKEKSFMLSSSVELTYPLRAMGKWAWPLTSMFNDYLADFSGIHRRHKELDCWLCRARGGHRGQWEVQRGTVVRVREPGASAPDAVQCGPFVPILHQGQI